MLHVPYNYIHKVREAQSKTKDRLDDLTLENSQLRRKLLLKSEEFCNYRSSIESTSAKTYREKVKIVSYSVRLLTTYTFKVYK